MLEPKNGELQVIKTNMPTEPSTTLQLAQTDSIDLTGLNDSQIAEIKMRHASGMIDLKRKAEEMRLDVGALDASLTSFNTQADKATKDGHSATIQHSQTTSIGRTEVIIGNTEKAASGKLSRSAIGEPNNILKIVLIVAAALVLIAVFMGKR